MSFFDTLKDSISQVIPGGASGPSSVIGLDVGTSSVKVVQIRKQKGKVLLETYGEIYIGPYASVENGKAAHISPEIVVPAVKDLFKESNVASNVSAMSIPFSSAMTKVIKVPKISRAQLEKVVPIEARKFIPMPLNEVVLNWSVLPEAVGYDDSKSTASFLNKDNKIDFQEALIVAIHKEAVSNIQSISRQLELQTKVYELETFSAIRSSVEYEMAPIMLVDIGAMSSKLYVVEAGTLRFSHLINIGAQNITENIMRSFSWPFEKAERLKKEIGLNYGKFGDLSDKDREVFGQAIETATNRIFTEINRVLINYEKKYNRSVARVVLAGGGANLIGVLDYAGKKLSVDVQKADSFAKIQTPAFLNEVLKSIGPDFSVASGLALRAADVS